MDKEIVFVFGDDWEGMYIDGKLACEDHILDNRTVLSALGITYNSLEADDEWLCDRGRLPKKLDDCNLQKD